MAGCKDVLFIVAVQEADEKQAAEAAKQKDEAAAKAKLDKETAAKESSDAASADAQVQC